MSARGNPAPTPYRLLVMVTMRRKRTVGKLTVAAGLAILASTGCAAGVAGAPNVAPSTGLTSASTASTSTSTGSTSTGSTSASTAATTSAAGSCPAAGTGTTDPTPEPAGDPVVMVVGETNAWEVSTLWSQPVALAVYDGGGAVRPVTAGETGVTVPAMEWGRVDPCRLDAALTELDDLVDADFGDPTVTDQGTTTVTLRAPGSDQPQQIAVYALSIDAGSLTDLTAAQLANRQRLTTALADLQSSVSDPQPWTPNRVRLIGLGEGGTDEQATYPWPGPDGIDASLERTNPDCVTLAGAPAATVLQRLGTGSSTATWTDGQRSASFTATVLVPGQPGCPE